MISLVGFNAETDQQDVSVSSLLNFYGIITPKIQKSVQAEGTEKNNSHYLQE